MSLELMLSFLIERHPHWSDAFIENLMYNPSKLIAIYMKELDKKDIQKRVVFAEPLSSSAPAYNPDYLDFLNSKEHIDWCLLED